jgi:tetratricopeptide (TPR) repeat protein
VGIFDFLRKGASVSAPDDPDQLRDALFDAVGSNNMRLFRQLLEARVDLIVASFPTWAEVPEAERDDPARVQWLSRGAMAIARHFAQERGDSSLLKRLESDEDDPVNRWQEAVETVEAHLRAAEWETALAVLETQLQQVRGLSGGSAETMLAITLGQIGRCHFAVGRIEEATDPLLEAMQLARDAEDVRGELAYLGNLAELFLYTGDIEQAADCFAEQAELLRETDAGPAAERAITRAHRVRAGSPLNRLLGVANNQTYELDTIPEQVGVHVRFIFQRNRPSLPASTHAVARGVEHGRAGRHDEALAAFEDASAADPFDPEGPYHRGLTLLHLKRPDQACEAFDLTERLAPGWLRVRADRFIAGELAAGRLPSEAFEALRAMEGEASTKDKLGVAIDALESIGRFPHLELELGEQYHELGKTRSARDVWEKALDPQPEPDVRTRLLTRLAMSTSKRGESRRLLEECLAVKDGNLIAQASARIALQTA